MTSYVEYNGKIISKNTPIASAANRGLRYGDGLFETMKVIHGEVVLSELHFDRLFHGLALLNFELPNHLTVENISERIRNLCRKNKLEKAAKIRINFFRADGGLYDPVNLTPNVVIQAELLPESQLNINENGLRIDIFPDARKSCDIFSNIKVNNFLPYAMAAFYAKKNKLNDALLLNSNQRISDTTTANIFTIKNQNIKTPPLSEGCIAGVLRRYFLAKAELDGYPIREEPLSIEQVQDADEVFLTNAIYGIRWVKQFRNKMYGYKLSHSLYERYIKNFHEIQKI